MSPDEQALIRLWRKSAASSTRRTCRAISSSNWALGVGDCPSLVRHPVHRYLAATLDGFVAITTRSRGKCSGNGFRAGRLRSKDLTTVEGAVRSAASSSSVASASASSNCISSWSMSRSLRSERAHRPCAATSRSPASTGRSSASALQAVAWACRPQPAPRALRRPAVRPARPGSVHARRRDRKEANELSRSRKRRAWGGANGVALRVARRNAMQNS
jgi:hypothetical protein